MDAGQRQRLGDPVRRLNHFAVLSAMALLSSPHGMQGVSFETESRVRSEAERLVLRFGHRYNGSTHPGELDRKSRQRRRARQTHPGKRGGR